MFQGDKYDLRKRTKAFALRAIRFFTSLPNTPVARHDRRATVEKRTFSGCALPGSHSRPIIGRVREQTRRRDAGVGRNHLLERTPG